MARITEYLFEEKIPKKLGDLGIPTISCTVGNLDINNDLCDVGVWVSVMSVALYNKLNLGECVPTGITLQVVDKSTKKTIE